MFINVMWFGQKCPSLTSQIVDISLKIHLQSAELAVRSKKWTVVLERVWGLIRRGAELDEGCLIRRSAELDEAWEVLRYWTVKAPDAALI